MIRSNFQSFSELSREVRYDLLVGPRRASCGTGSLRWKMHYTMQVSSLRRSVPPGQPRPADVDSDATHATICRSMSGCPSSWGRKAMPDLTHTCSPKESMSFCDAQEEWLSHPRLTSLASSVSSVNSILASSLTAPAGSPLTADSTVCKNDLRFEAHYVGDPGDPEVQDGPSRASQDTSVVSGQRCSLGSSAPSPTRVAIAARQPRTAR